MASFISLAILFPMLIPSPYFRYEYGEPWTYRFVPATILADISNAMNSISSVHIVSTQKGPTIPGSALIIFSRQFPMIAAERVNLTCRSR